MHRSFSAAARAERKKAFQCRESKKRKKRAKDSAGKLQCVQ